MLFYYTLLIFFFVTTVSKNLCINCKYYIHSLNKIGNNRLEIGKCKLFPIETNIKLKDYSFCSTSRENATTCGTKGLYYAKNDNNKMDPLFILCKQMREEKKRIETKIINEEDEIKNIQSKMNPSPVENF